MSDVPRPGEVDLETGATAPVDEAATETAETTETVETAAAAEATTEAAATAETTESEPEPVRHKGAVAELIANRRELKAARERLQQIEGNPVLQRLTPELQQAILEGRVVLAPPQGSREAEKERLESVAKDLGLFKGDNTPDLEAAARVDKYVRGAVRAEVEPVRNMTLADKANANVSLAINHAKANKLPVDVIEDTYLEIMRQPNGAQMLSQPEVATTVWHQAIGRAYAMGKLTQAQAAAATTETKGPARPAVVVTEGTGRRSTTAGISLSPAIAKVYKDNGLDPSKGFAKPANLNPASIELE